LVLEPPTPGHAPDFSRASIQQVLVRVGDDLRLVELLALLFQALQRRGAGLQRLVEGGEALPIGFGGCGRRRHVCSTAWVL